MRRSRRMGDRGFVLISSYLLLAVFLGYSTTMTMYDVRQRAAADHIHDQAQALALVQGVTEELREDFGYFLTTIVYQQVNQGNAVAALQWLDALGRGTENPPLDIPFVDRNKDGLITSADGDGTRDGTAASPLCLPSLPTVNSKAAACQPTTAPVQAPRAWIVSVANPGEDLNKNGLLDAGEDANGNGALDPPGLLTPRRMTIRAQAQVGSVVKTIQTTYQIDLGTSDIFRYAYFINNYGWVNAPKDTQFFVQGEMRSNGDLTLGGKGWLQVNGDLYASQNPEVSNPTTGLPAQGTIAGDPGEADDWTHYWQWKSAQSRPARRLTAKGQPAINGVAKTLPYGYGWDSDYPSPDVYKPDQRRFESQSTQPIPYLGDLTLYKNLATGYRSKSGQPPTLSYIDPGPDKDYMTSGDNKRVTLTGGIYYGPDGVAGTKDDKDPLVLVGRVSWGSDRSVQVNGPWVIPGDVIIRGEVSGRGTLYSGRNVHIVGDGIYYRNGPIWPGVERNQDTGQIRSNPDTYDSLTDMGSVCNNGAYVPSSAGAPATRCQP